MWPTRCLLMGLLVVAGCRDSPDAVVYHQDIAPILHSRCAACHRPEGAAPFSLLTYEDARDRASQIADVTRSRFMPPWLPESGHEKFALERRLTEREIELIALWASAGAREGDSLVASQTPKFSSSWLLGDPDLVLDSPAFELPAAGPDRFRNFVLSVPLESRRWVRAVELRPNQPTVTHHIRLGIDDMNESARRDAADPGPGYEGMAWGADPEGQLITWTPGMQADVGTPGAAWPLSPESQLILHTHLDPSGKPEIARFQVGLYFADEAPTVHPQILRVGSRDIDIPAGAADHVVRDEYELPVDVVVHSVFPHAHSLCREILLEAESPNRASRTLIHIKRFDENWHDKYRFARPIKLSKGTRLTTQFHYDNTSGNIRNPHNPPQRVVYGSNAADEMCDVYLQVTLVHPEQRAVLAEHYGQYELASKIVGHRKHLELHAEDPWSREALASCYLARKEAELAIQVLAERPQATQHSPQAGVIRGMALLAASDLAAAEEQFQEVLGRDDQQPLAWAGLGQTLARQQRPQEAEEALRRAVGLAPQVLIARLDLIDLLTAEQRWSEAQEECETAIEIDPSAHQPHLKLANILAAQNRYDESLASFAKARELAPFVYSPEASLAIACYQNGEETKASELLRQAQQLDPRDPVPHCFLGQIARRNGDWQTAGEELRKSLDLPLPDIWPASHVRQFLILVYTEQLLLAQETEDRDLLISAAEAWLELEPGNRQLQQLLENIKP